MGKVRHPINSNSGEVKCGTQPEKGINIARHRVNSYSITVAHVKSVTHVSFWSGVYLTTFWAERKEGTYGTESVYSSIRWYEAQSEPSELTGTPRCFWRKLGLLLMQQERSFLNLNMFAWWMSHSSHQCIQLHNSPHWHGSSINTSSDSHFLSRSVAEPNWRAGSSKDPNCHFGYGSIEMSLAVWIWRVVSWLSSGFIIRNISCA